MDDNENINQQDSDEATSKSGLNRRDILKRGAIVGGAMWAAPVVQKVRLTQSVAQQPSPIEPTPTPNPECETWVKFYAKVDGNGIDNPNWETGSNFNVFCLDACKADGATGKSGAGIFELTPIEGQPKLVMVNVIPGPVRYRILEVWTKNGSGDSQCAGDGGQVASDGQSATAGQHDHRNGISHVEICFECCADDLV